MRMENIIPRYFPGEQEAIKTVINHGAAFGYGNLINRLQEAWSEHLQKQGIDKAGADMAAGIICVYCKTNHRTGKKVKV